MDPSTEIAVLLDSLSESLYTRDLERAMALFVDDENVAVIPSEGVDVYRGSEGVRALMAYICGGSRRFGWNWNDRWFVVDGSIGHFVASGAETIEQDGAVTIVPYCLTGIARNTPQGWRLILLHGSEDTAAAVPAGRSD